MSERTRKLLQTNRIRGNTSLGQTLATGRGQFSPPSPLTQVLSDLGGTLQISKNGWGVPKLSIRTELTFAIAADLVFYAICFQ